MKFECDCKEAAEVGSIATEDGNRWAGGNNGGEAVHKGLTKSSSYCHLDLASE